MRSDLIDTIQRAFEANQRRRAEEADALEISLDEYDRRERESEEAEKRAEADQLRRMRVVQVLRPYVERIGVATAEAVVGGSARSTPAVDAVRTFCESSKRPILVLSGGVGTGKTVASILELTRRRPHTADYCHASDLAKRYEPWSADLERGVRALDLSIPFLVVDDLGSERGDDPRFTEAIGQVIDRRIGPGISDEGEMIRRITIVTTNLFPKDLGAKYGERIADRFREHAQAVVLQGDSMRGGKR